MIIGTAHISAGVDGPLLLRPQGRGEGGGGGLLWPPRPQLLPVSVAARGSASGELKACLGCGLPANNISASAQRLACAAWRRHDHTCRSLPQQRQRAHLSPFCCRFHLTLPVYYRSFGAHYTSLLSMHPLCCRGYLTVYYNDRMIREAQVGYSSR